MVVHKVFAQIYKDEIKNIIVCDNYELANYITRVAYEDTAFAVDCLQYPCSIGDKYKNGIFYEKDGVIEIERQPTQEQEVLRMAEEISQKEEQITYLELALTEQYEENSSLQEEITGTQIALTEIYERLEV